MGRQDRRTHRGPLGATTLLARLLVYWHTVRYLRISQILWRLWYRIYNPTIDCRNPPQARERYAYWQTHVTRDYSLLSPQRVRFLNVEADISSENIWNDWGKSKLWLYNLHYFDDLNAINAVVRVDWHRVLIERWVSENPPGVGNGWEPYPTSLRVVNWIKWLASGNAPTPLMQQSLATQVRWLEKKLEFHILGNHLLANAKALCFAGLYFFGEEADRWWARGLRILQDQLKEQILSDGGHFELSPMYHLIVLEDLLDIVQLCRIYERPAPRFLTVALPRMCFWSQVMRHPDGEIPFFNDATFGVAGTPGELDSYASDFGVITKKLVSPRQYLPSSGYLKISDRGATLFADLAAVGPDYLPGHAHADTLSFELSLGLRRVVVNGGTSVYGTDHERQRQRATTAHSTVTIDGESSSEVWGGFRVARRARVEQVKVSDGQRLWASGAHDGYKRFSGSPVHHREWRFAENSLEVVDEITGNGEHAVDINFPLGPGLVPRRIDSSSIEVVDVQSGNQLCVFCSSLPDSTSLEETTWHPRFGVTLPTWRIVIRSNQPLPLKHVAEFTWTTSH